MRVGFLGLGTMGRPMATNLVKTGHRLKVWNRSPEPVAALEKLGATAAATPVEAVTDVDAVLSILADDEVTRHVIVESGALDAMAPGTIDVNMATVSVALAREFERRHRERDLRYIAAPVLGRVNVAEAGELNILAAGDAGALADLEPLFEALGRKTWIFGDRPESANAVKLAANTMIATAIASMGEASALVSGYGIDKAEFIDLVTSTLFATPVYKGYGAAIAQERYTPPGFKLALGLKDVRLALAAAEAVNVPSPIASVLRDSHLDGLAHGDGDLDWAALARVAARRAGQV